MIIISVNQPIGCVVEGNRPACYFRRELNLNKDINISIENIVNVLHFLFSGVKHTINIDFIY